MSIQEACRAAHDGDVAALKTKLKNPAVLAAINKLCKVEHVTRFRVTLPGFFELSALGWASRNGHGDCVDLLLAAGADVNTQDSDGDTALHLAVSWNHSAVATKLLSTGKCNLKLKRNSLKTALQYAQFTGTTQIVALIEEYAAHPAAFAGWAAAGGTAAQLLDGKAARAAPAQKACQAASNGDVAALKTELKSPAVLAAINEQCGKTSALGWASRNGHGECVDLLLKEGADVNSQSSYNGNTPLNLAVDNNHPAVVAKLLSTSKCNLELTDCSNKTAFQYAQDKKRTNIVALIVQYAASDLEALRSSAAAQKEKNKSLEGKAKKLQAEMKSRGDRLAVAESTIEEMTKKLETVQGKLEMVRSNALSEGDADANVAAAAAAHAAKDATPAVKLAVLCQTSPSTAVAVLYKARKARVHPTAAASAAASAGAAFEPRAQLDDPDMAEAVAALREQCPPNDEGSSSSSPAAAAAAAAAGTSVAAAAPDFEVPRPLEAALAAADAAQARLDKLNTAIAETCASAVETDIDVDVDAACIAVQERDRARAQYVEVASSLQSEYAADRSKAAVDASFIVSTRFGHVRAALPDAQQTAAVPDPAVPPTGVAASAVAAVNAWCNRAALQQAAATKQTEAAAAALSTALSTLAGDAAGLSAAATAAPTMSLADGELEAACARLIEAVQEEADTLTASTYPGTFPTETVVAAVHCLEAAATEALHRFETIDTAVKHHQAISTAAAEWVDPAAKDALITEVVTARRAKRGACIRLIEVEKELEIRSLRTASDDDSSSEASIPGAMPDALRAAKVGVAHATKDYLQMQCKIAGVIRDHFPELCNDEAVRKDLLITKIGELGGLPTYDSMKHYELGNLLKTTGLHEMWRASHLGLGLETKGGGSGGDGILGDVILKQFDLASPLDDPRSRKTFEKELKIMVRLRHPNVVRLTGVVYDIKKQKAYLEMPFMQHGDLRKYLEHDPPRRAEAEVQQTLFADLMKALEYLHMNGVVHLDVTPDNILIAEDGTAKLADFDVSKDAAARTVAVETAAATTMAATGLTLGYAAPEVLEAAASQTGGGGGRASSSALSASGVVPRCSCVGPAADVWSAGCVLFFMAFYPAEVTVDMRSEPADHIPATCKNDNLRSLLGRMFATEAHARPTAAEALASVYMQVQSRRELAARSALISAEEKALQERCDEAAAAEALLGQKQQDVATQQEDVCKQLVAAGAEKSHAAEGLAELKVKAAALRKQEEDVRKDQEAAAADHAKVKREQARMKQLESLAFAPAYWKARELDDSAPTTRVDVTREMQDCIRLLMNETAKPDFHGKGRNNVHGVNFRKFEPRKVWRIESHQQWRKYVLQRNAVRVNVNKRANPTPIIPPPATDGFRLPSGALLDKGSNEHWLFHGTNSAAIDVLCNRGFDERVARTRKSVGTEFLRVSLSNSLFGAGCYFAESSSKSDEYVPSGAKQYMFLCRVVVGSPFVTPEPHRRLRRPPCLEGHVDEPPCGHDRWDSLLGVTRETDPGAHLLNFREFVVYDHSQCYPEYLIEYERQ